jgi:hypothetical protein
MGYAHMAHAWDALELLGGAQGAWARARLTMPLGPSVDLTRSAIATAPTNDACGELNEGSGVGIRHARAHATPPLLPKRWVGHDASVRRARGATHQAGVFTTLLGRSLLQDAALLRHLR